LSSQQYPTSSASSIMLSIKIKHNQLTH
jgi:hypothetical protein